MEQAQPSQEILRFKRAERMLHWGIVVPYVICYLTALILFIVYNPDPTRPFRAVFSWAHRISAIGFIVLPPLAVIVHIRDIGTHFRNLREGWIWGFSDIKWLLLMGVAALNPKIKLPEEGKFNAAEKINFMMVMVAYPVFVSSGLLIWILGDVLLPWAAHFTMAALMTPLIFGHVYMATLNPKSRRGLSGMITGYVSAQWASHHYRRWYREEFGEHSVAVDSPTVDAVEGSGGMRGRPPGATDDALEDLVSDDADTDRFDTSSLTEAEPLSVEGPTVAARPRSKGNPSSS